MTMLLNLESSVKSLHFFVVLKKLLQFSLTIAVKYLSAFAQDFTSPTSILNHRASTRVEFYLIWNAWAFLSLYYF